MSETPQQAARRLSASAIKGGFKPEALHEYKDASGKVLYWRIRLKHANGDKRIWPMHLNGHGYDLKEPEFTGLKPLYRLPELLAHADEIVWFVEGEWSADHLARLVCYPPPAAAIQAPAKRTLHRWQNGI
jgi:putative DNA primase/helicase